MYPFSDHERAALHDLLTVAGLRRRVRRLSLEGTPN
jgi:hypothetical protein